MASGTGFSSDPPSPSPSPIETLNDSRNGGISFVLPFILINPHQETENQDSPRETRDRIVLINPFTQTMIVLESSPHSGLDSFFDGKNGRRPASRAAIDAMGTVAVERAGEQCAICLEEWEIGEKLKEMPCKHRFCGGCIEKWLRVSGSCPVCRYEVPVEGGDDS